MHLPIKEKLANGLTVIVYPVSTIPKVAIQLWYNVGSKDEKDGQKGLAHLLEHMIFKGTDILSESDINLISHKLSGNCNAFTSHDYTGYLFDFPTQNWHVALPLLANCMRQCTFKEDLLNSELKAVIQELKMYKDDYYSSLCEQMISAIFSDHPYHYPIIGYKQDLWSITREGLLAFYKQHYIPNNATLVLVGDVNPQEAILKAKESFENIPADFSYTKETYPYFFDLTAKQTTLYRDVQHPIVMFAWVIPGIKENKTYITDWARWILGEGKGSLLYKKLVDELGLASDVQVDVYELFDKSVLFVHIEPIDLQSIQLIEQVVKEEINILHQNGVDTPALIRAGKQALMENMSIFENNQKIAYEIGKLYAATNNQNALFETLGYDACLYKKDIDAFFSTYIKSAIMHKGLVLPLADKEKEAWCRLQEESDKQDQIILSRKVRESTVECGIFVEQVIAQQATNFNYPQAKKTQLPNRAKLLWHNTAQTPKINIIVELPAKHYYDPEEKQGLINFMSELMLEGTQDYPGYQFAHEAESRGMGIDIRAGTIVMSMLKEDFSFGLQLLESMLCRASFAPDDIEKIRTQITTEIINFWDQPTEFVNQLVQSELYKNHPYHKNILGTLTSIKAIGRSDLLQAYKKFVTPVGARIAIVGDLENIDVEKIVFESLKKWEGHALDPLEFPPLASDYKKNFSYTINRDQTLLAYAAPSISRLDKRYDALLLFDQIFSGGILGSMSSYLFQLREQTGLFYTIAGSLIAHSDEQPGMVFIRTLVSNDRLQEAQTLIEKAVEQAKTIITDKDIEHARNAILNSLVDNFESNDSMAQAFLFIDRFNLPSDYFDRRMEKFKAISKQEIIDAVESVLNINRLMKIKIGRFEQ